MNKIAEKQIIDTIRERIEPTHIGERLAIAFRKHEGKKITRRMLKTAREALPEYSVFLGCVLRNDSP